MKTQDKTAAGETVLPATGVSQLLTKEDVSSVKKMKKVKTV
jgi:hypothetical protein